MKKALIAMAVAALLLTIAPVAAAKGPTKARAKAFTVNGKVVATDTTLNTITLKVWGGSQGIRRYRGQELTITLLPTAKIVRYAYGEPTLIALADVKAGERIRAWGTIDRSDPNLVVYKTKRVSLRATWPFSLQGSVTAVDAVAKTVSVRVTKASAAVKQFIGEELLLNIADDAAIMKWIDGELTAITLADVAVGDRVKVGGKVDNLEPQAKVYMVKRLIVRPAL